MVGGPGFIVVNVGGPTVRRDARIGGGPQILTVRVDL